MVFSIIQKSKLEGQNRLDAEYYEPNNLDKAKRLANAESIRLGDISYITDGEHGSPIFDSKSGIKYFSAQHVKDCYIDSENVNNISKIIDEKNKRSRLQLGDILISTVGTIGFAGLVTEECLPANIDRHVARIHLKERLSPEFLVVFLNSSYGRFQSIRESTGNVQLNLFINKINDILVPKKDNAAVSELMKLRIQEIKKSKSFYFDAEALLLQELGLKDFKVDEELFFTAKLSDVKSANRIDPDYYLPKFDTLLSKLGKFNRLSYIAKRRSGEFKLVKDQEYQYTEISDVSVGDGEVSSNGILGAQLPVNAKIQLNSGELIISKVRPTRGAIAIIPDNWEENHVVSGAFSVFDVESPSREYLQVVLRSIIGKLQMERPTTGTSYPTITDNDIENLLIPILPKPAQEKIANLVNQSHRSRKKAKDLLKQAKQQVEELIEKG